MSTDSTLLFLLLLVVFPIWDYIETPRLRATSDVNARTSYYWRIVVVEWTVAAIAIIIVGFHGVYAIRIGSHADWLPRPALVWPFLLAYGLGLIIPVAIVARRKPERTPFAKQIAAIDYLLPKTGLQRIIFLLVSVTAGVCEEVLFRGFTLGYLQHLPLAPPIWVCLLLSAALFGLIHIGQGMAGAISTGILGLIFGAVFLAFGNLGPAIVLHVITDARFAILPTQPRRTLQR